MRHATRPLAPGQRPMAVLGALLAASPPPGEELDAIVAGVVDRDDSRLLDAALARWGSPLLEKSADRWSGSVRRSAAALATRHVIGTFFDAAGADEHDPRRASFWVGYSPAIEAVRLFFGCRSVEHGGPDVTRTRVLLGDAARTLDDDEANALVMTIGGHAFVEVHLIGSDLYMHPLDALPFRLDGPPPSLHDLKRMGPRSRCLWHTGAWERRAAAVIDELTARVLAQSDRDLLLDPLAPAAQARHLHQRR